ncbi:hypothetical protein XENOCAPTIV_030696, partial [Xenoophorus captivus]
QQKDPAQSVSTSTTGQVTPAASSLVSADLQIPTVSADVAADIAKYTNKIMDTIKGTMTEIYNDLSKSTSGNTIAEIRRLRIEIEKLQWLHQQELSEMKHNLDERQSQSGGVDAGARPSLSQVKKSWGFRRTTIARREFMEEVGDLTHSPPLVRRGRSRRAIQAPETNTEDGTKQKTTRTARSVIEDLQWSAPSSPVSEDSKEPSETCAGGAFDPSLWQDLGSAFHTAFSLLGGNEGLSLTDALAVPAFLGPANEIEPTDLQPVEENEVPENLEDMDITQPVAPDNVTERESDYVVLISSQEEDSDEMTLLQIKEQLATSSRPGDSKAREKLQQPDLLQSPKDELSPKTTR